MSYQTVIAISWLFLAVAVCLSLRDENKRLKRKLHLQRKHIEELEKTDEDAA